MIEFGAKQRMNKLIHLHRKGTRLIMAALLLLLPMSMAMGGCSEELFAHRDEAAREKSLYFPDPHPIENYNKYGQPSNNPQNFSSGGGF